MIESWIATFVSFLLSLVGTHTSVNGPYIYVPSINHQFVVTQSCTDFVGISLWGFTLVFLIWIYSNIAGFTMSRRSYALMSGLGFSVFFVANILRMFTEILYVSNGGTAFVSNLLQWSAFEQEVSIGIMLATLTIMLLGFHLAVKNRRNFLTSPRKQTWLLKKR